MAEVIKLTNKYIDVSNVYDSNKSKTQQQFNSDISSNVSTLSGTVSGNYTTLNNKITSTNTTVTNNYNTLNNKITTINNTLPSKANYDTSIFNNVKFFNNLPNERFAILEWANKDRSGVRANYSTMELIFTKSGLFLSCYNTTNNSWETIWSK